MNPSICSNLLFNIICLEPIKLEGLFTLLFSVSAIVVSVTTLFRQSSLQKSNNLLYTAEIIHTTRKDLDDLCLQRSIITGKGEEIPDYEKLQDTKLEAIIYAFEIACTFYQSKLVDKKLFRTIRQQEVLQLIELEPFKTITKDKGRSYKNLWKAYTKFKC